LLAGFLLAYITATNRALLGSFGGRVPILEVDRENVTEVGGDPDPVQAALVSALEARA
jgi:hypothetical protein